MSALLFPDLYSTLSHARLDLTCGTSVAPPGVMTQLPPIQPRVRPRPPLPRSAYDLFALRTARVAKKVASFFDVSVADVLAVSCTGEGPAQHTWSLVSAGAHFMHPTQPTCRRQLFPACGHAPSTLSPVPIPAH